MKFFVALIAAAAVLNGVWALPAGPSPRDDAEVIDVNPDFNNFKGVIDTDSVNPFLTPTPRPFSHSFGFSLNLDDLFRRMYSHFWPLDLGWAGIGGTDDSSAGTDISFPDAAVITTNTTVKIEDGHKTEIIDTVYENDKGQVIHRVRQFKFHSLGWNEDAGSAESTTAATAPDSSPDAKKVTTNRTVKVEDGHKIEIIDTLYEDDNGKTTHRVRQVKFHPMEWDENSGSTESTTTVYAPTTSAPRSDDDNVEEDDDRREPLEDKKPDDNEINGKDIDHPEFSVFEMLPKKTVATTTTTAAVNDEFMAKLKAEFDDEALEKGSAKSETNDETDDVENKAATEAVAEPSNESDAEEQPVTAPETADKVNESSNDASEAVTESKSESEAEQQQQERERESLAEEGADTEESTGDASVFDESTADRESIPVVFEKPKLLDEAEKNNGNSESEMHGANPFTYYQGEGDPQDTSTGVDDFNNAIDNDDIVRRGHPYNDLYVNDIAAKQGRPIPADVDVFDPSTNNARFGVFGKRFGKFEAYRKPIAPPMENREQDSALSRAPQNSGEEEFKSKS